MSERINRPIPSTELQRRWADVRARMKEDGLDVLLMQANNDFMGGYVKYFTDVPATNGYPVTVIFPREEDMVVIGQGAFGMVQKFDSPDALRRGTAMYLGTPSYAPIGFTASYDSDLASTELQKFSQGTVGIVGKGTISATLLDDLRAGVLFGAKWKDASDLVDAVKCRKSEVEIALMRETALLQDQAWKEVIKAIRPGMRDLELAGIAEQACRRGGSEQGLFMCASGPIGSPALFANRHLQNREIKAGDYFSLLIESNGAGGYYTELGRTCVLGKATQEMQDEAEFVRSARRFTLDRLRPGTSGPKLWKEYNEFLAENNRPAEKRLHCHGQGYDMVERPLMRHDESMVLATNMVIACHPTYATSTTYNWVCDNYLIGDGGTPLRMHETEDKIFELG